MSDLISRQAAIDAICNDCTLAKAGKRCTDAFCPDVRRLKEVPSAQMKGEWKYNPNDYDDNTWECSVCKEPWTLIDGTPQDNNMNYCPNCGSDMRGEKDE